VAGGDLSADHLSRRSRLGLRRPWRGLSRRRGVAILGCCSSQWAAGRSRFGVPGSSSAEPCRSGHHPSFFHREKRCRVRGSRSSTSMRMCRKGLLSRVSPSPDSSCQALCRLFPAAAVRPPSLSSAQMLPPQSVGPVLEASSGIITVPAGGYVPKNPPKGKKGTWRWKCSDDSHAFKDCKVKHYCYICDKVAHPMIWCPDLLPLLLELACWRPNLSCCGQ
jgi:hypothetical protein